MIHAEDLDTRALNSSIAPSRAPWRHLSEEALPEKCLHTCVLKAHSRG